MWGNGIAQTADIDFDKENWISDREVGICLGQQPKNPKLSIEEVSVLCILGFLVTRCELCCTNVEGEVP